LPFSAWSLKLGRSAIDVVVVECVVAGFVLLSVVLLFVYAKRGARR